MKLQANIRETVEPDAKSIIVEFYGDKKNIISKSFVRLIHIMKAFVSGNFGS